MLENSPILIGNPKAWCKRPRKLQQFRPFLRVVQGDVECDYRLRQEGFSQRVHSLRPNFVSPFRVESPTLILCALFMSSTPLRVFFFESMASRGTDAKISMPVQGFCGGGGGSMQNSPLQIVLRAKLHSPPCNDCRVIGMDGEEVTVWLFK